MVNLITAINRTPLAAKKAAPNSEHITSLRTKYQSDLNLAIKTFKELKDKIQFNEPRIQLEQHKNKLITGIKYFRSALSYMRKASQLIYSENHTLMRFSPHEKQLLNSAAKQFSISRGRLYEAAYRSLGEDPEAKTPQDRADRLFLRQDLPNLLSSKILQNRGNELDNFLQQVSLEIIAEAPSEVNLNRPNLDPISVEPLLEKEQAKVLRALENRQTSASAGTVLHILHSVTKLFGHKPGEKIKASLKTWVDDFTSAVIKHWAEKSPRGQEIDPFLLSNIQILYHNLSSQRRELCKRLASHGLPSSQHKLTDDQNFPQLRTLRNQHRAIV